MKYIFKHTQITMLNFLGSIMLEICAENLNNEDIFNLNSFHANEILNEISEIVESWLHICDSLTRLFWPNNGSHPWIGEPYIPKQAAMFQERLNEIKSIKNMYKQIASIFCENLQMMQSIKMVFLPFKGIFSAKNKINILMINLTID